MSTKYKYLSVAFATLICSACAKTELETSSPAAKGTEITITAAREGYDLGVKTVRMSDGSVEWCPSDEISVFYTETADGGSRFIAQNTDTVAIAEFKGRLEGLIAGGEDFINGKYLYGVYPYSSGTRFKDGVTTITLPSHQTAVEGTFANGLFPTIARAQGVNLAFYNICGGVKFTVSRSDIVSVVFKGNNNERLAGTANVVFNEYGKPSVTDEQLDSRDAITVYAPDGGTFKVGKEYFIVIYPVNLGSGYTMTFQTSGQKEGIYENNSAVEVKRSVFGVVRQADQNVSSWTDNHDYVDLGLSVKWATCNVGAEKPEDYGDYFAWGATEPWYQPGYAQSGNPVWKSGKSAGYTWVNTPYQTATATDYSSTKWTKYLGSTTSSYKDASATDADALKTVLDPADDAAHVNWGGSWRMPTEAEFGELCNTDNCTWTWTTLNGVNGYKVVSKKSGYAGNWIFLPAAGYRGGSVVTDGPDGTYLDNVGSRGSYWSSSLAASSPLYAYHLYFYSISGDWYGYYSYGRLYGQSVRPVCPVPVTGIGLDRQSVEIMEGYAVTLTATVQLENGTTVNTATWSSSNTGIATVDQTGKITAISAGTCTITASSGSFTATCSVTVKANTHQYVDLGLSVKWATFNVGAEKPEDYGDYFAWGATEPWYQPGYAQSEDPVWKSGKRAGYTWVNTPYQTANTTDYSDYSSTKWTKYLGSTTSSYKDASATDADALKTVLDPADDAAHANWGGSWRMPTKAEQDELRNTDNCTWTWTTMNDVSGYKVVSKKSGYAGNWIFLPAAGYRDDGRYLYGVGSHGIYWSSSLYAGYPSGAYDLYFLSRVVDWGGSDRYVGHSVRPVCP